MKKDTSYYNQEGDRYSKKRYPERDTDYVHFFFKKRRRILMSMLSGIAGHACRPLSLLEIGCADGILVNEIHDQEKTFSPLVAVDISPDMIAVARRNNTRSIEFSLRDSLPSKRFDVIIEIGVLNLTDLDTDLRFAVERLADEGYYICTLASRTSLLSRLKMQPTDFAHHLSFKEYEMVLRKTFTIVQSEGYGVFVPHIWKSPGLARWIQPLAEYLASLFSPNWFHERIYLLKKNV